MASHGKRRTWPGEIAYSAFILGKLLGKSIFGSAIQEQAPPCSRAWWQKPGFGIQYQVELRPGWNWHRDFTAFIKSMSGPDGKLQFNGPTCRIEDWVSFSKLVHVDYHQFQSKWHDGICYFNTQTTEWKTEIDYAAIFARLSREAAIPFLYYYSNIFDHNPQFLKIQPHPNQTISFIGNLQGDAYLDYLREHCREIAEQYHPDGMWFDWYWPDRSTDSVIEYFRKNYPEIVLGFNGSNYQATAFSRIDFTSGEAHDPDGPLIRIRKDGEIRIPVFAGTWKWANILRVLSDHPWEVCGPAGRFWQDPRTRDDRNDLLRMVAIALACGGKYLLGMPSRLDGTLFPEHVEQVMMLGEWYAPRKHLFIEAVALRYFGGRPPGVVLDQPEFRCVSSLYDQGFLLHIINMKGASDSVRVALSEKDWRDLKTVHLEPEHRKLDLIRREGKIQITLQPSDLDPVDTILLLSR